MEPYGTSQMKFDQDEEEQYEDKVGKKRKRKIVFENPLKDQPNNEQASELFSKELFTILKSQIHIYKTFILDDQPIRQDLFDALINFSSAHLVKTEPKEIEEPSEKRQKLDDSCEIQFLESRSYSNYERVPISLQLLKLNRNEELNNFHITEFQNLIYKKYAVHGLFMPDYYTLENAPFDPETIHDSIFIQVLHAENHWIVLANLHPTYEDSDGFNNWFIYDSLNNPKNYLNRIKTVLKSFSGGSRFFDIIHVNVTKQKGNKDCGLFALGYALSLAMNLDPGKLIFDQKKIRDEFNTIIKSTDLFLFSHSYVENYSAKFTKLCIDLE
ncbi:unnamed protein product [Brachionus calyciflorus]|uniref:Ubiquitin-like protease family profile domain-containing protein n=1 Tax=Brachionus calyciflorus TaxID=104777 RepID=A0A814DFG1_9BILA|nr:unnamed protein product [Brachionus calyciflorus]